MLMGMLRKGVPEMNKEKLIKTPQEAIECIKSNYPTSGYEMLKEALDMAIVALEKEVYNNE